MQHEHYFSRLGGAGQNFEEAKLLDLMFSVLISSLLFGDDACNA